MDLGFAPGLVVPGVGWYHGSMISFEEFSAWLDSDGSTTLDFYAQDPDDWAFLEPVLPGLRVTSAGGLLPFQASGTLEGRPFYYREEWGSANLRVGPLGLVDKFNHVSNQDADYDASMAVPDGREIQFARVLPALVANLAVSPTWWTFHGLELRFLDVGWEREAVPGTVEEYHGWGMTAEEGYADAMAPSDYLAEKGYTLEGQVAHLLSAQVSPVPVSGQEKHVPKPGTIFRVNLP